jgi:hypothetical protein
MRGHLDWGAETARYHNVCHDPGSQDYVEDPALP